MHISASNYFYRLAGSRLLVAWLLLICCILPAIAQSTAIEVQLPSMPQTVDQFLALRAEQGSKPEGAAALFCVALLRYSEDQAAALPMLVSILVNDGSLLQAAAAGKGYRGFDLTRNTYFLVDRVLDAPWIARSYVRGTSPDAAYALPAGSLRFTVSTNPYSNISADDVKLFVASSGADSPRPLRLKRNSAGLWKVAEFSSLVVGVRTPAAADGDDL
ncbi:MAG: hypothetical protein KKI09_15855 [Spirochaetes bacterium]|nr:hypothetical protein [Spirochaetota bacterium]MBU0956897.1 hypothetical protein [Spirochaetota bacterium]